MLIGFLKLNSFNITYMGTCNAHDNGVIRGVTRKDFALITVLGKGGFGKAN